MIRFLKFVEMLGFWLSFGMVPLYLAASWFVMRNAAVQEFITANGASWIYLFALVAFFSGKLYRRIETTKVSNRDANVCGWIGLLGLFFGIFILMGSKLAPTPQSAGLGGIIMALSIFMLALSYAFEMKAGDGLEKHSSEQSQP